VKFIEDWEEKVCEADRFRNMRSKDSMIRLIRKYYRNDDGSVPRWSVLKGLTLYALCRIWRSKVPRGLFDKFARV